MFERFTGSARKVVVLAQDEARQMNHSEIDTEHVLLGLLAEAEGVAARTLNGLGVTIEGVRQQVLEVTPLGNEPLIGQVPFTYDAKQVLELALRQALALGHNYIGTEHLLLALAAEKEDTLAKRILTKCDVDPEAVKQGVLNVLAGKPVSASAGQVIVQAPPSVHELNYGEMSASDLSWLVVNATIELARRVDPSS